MQQAQSYIEEHKQRFLSELLDLLRLPSISADSAYDAQTAQTADLVAKSLREAGLDGVEVITTAGHPVVYAERLIDASLPTVLVYGHYDVQPPDPLDLWDSPPFEPVIKKSDLHPDGAIYARGACDDKGQMYMHVKAAEAMIKTDTLPCNIKFMIEGEEETGSENLGPFCKEYKDKLSCDVVLVSDTSTLSLDTPSITVGLRGLSYMEVEVTGPNKDLHSGVYGGAVANPVNILSTMLASLHDEDRKISIPGFYDDVEVLSDADRAAMNAAPFDINLYKKGLDIDATLGEKGYTVLEQTSIRPTLDINGMWGGYTGEGAKTVLPSKAYAKVSMRLVPHQDSATISALFKKHLEEIAPPGIKVKVTPHHGGAPYVTPSDTPEFAAASKAVEHSLGKEPIPVRSGGSIPIVALFEEVLEVKTVLMGFGYNTDDIHSPNEHYGIRNFYAGIRTIPYFYHYYKELK
jgi:acetylornithine deacetylase/succinyl-diaminopimelate desuccinylase-like protein